ncbi:MAG: MlaC/ttg2D family ABC transporter substrate-binding protein [Thermodesulfobacteriota bacterium]
MITRWFSLVCLLGCLGLQLDQEPAWAGEPMDAIKQSTDQVLDILRDPALKEDPEAREKRIWEVVSSKFDFEEMARRSLAVHWRDRSPQEQREFVDLFGKLLQRSYSGKLGQYTDEKVEYLGEETDGSRAEVRTKIVSKGVDIPIDYRMLKKSDGWKVYDVIIEGVSLVNNYRNQFNRIVVSSGYKDLIQRMRTKWDELIKESEKKKGAT